MYVTVYSIFAFEHSYIYMRTYNQAKVAFCVVKLYSIQHDKSAIEHLIH